MPNGILNGAQSGAVVGAITGGLIYVALKVFKLDRYLNTKGSKPALSDTPSSSPPDDGRYPPTPYLAGMSPAATQSALIATMWALTGILYVASVASKGMPVVLTVLMDVPAFIIAIILVCKRGTVNKANGWTKLGLEAIAFVVSFMIAAHQAPQQAPFGAPPSLPGTSAGPGMPMPTPPNFAPAGHINAPPNFPVPPMPAMPQPPGTPR